MTETILPLQVYTAGVSKVSPQKQVSCMFYFFP